MRAALSPANLPYVLGEHRGLPFRDSAGRRALFLIGFLSLWSILGRYKGIQHDALVYMLQALVKLNPEPLAGDIFLRFRSQEEFTVFPGLAATLVGWLDIDRAAALMTASFLSLWILAAVVLLRRLQGTALTWLSVALLLVIPGWYSAGEVFRYAELFVTARLLAEAGALAALAAAVCGRWPLASVFALAAIVVHPLMAFPAVLALLFLRLPLTNGRRWAGLMALMVAGAIAGSFVLGGNEPFIGGAWLDATRWRSGFLFPSEWTTRDWEVVGQTLLTAGLAAWVLPESPARSLVRAVWAVSCLGLVLACVADAVLPLKVLLQGQAWRWLWLSRFLAIALLPLTLITLYREGSVGRATALLVACAWLLTDAGSFQDLPPAGLGGLLCALALILRAARTRLSPPAATLVFGLACGTAALVALTFASIVVVTFRHYGDFGLDPPWVQRAMAPFYTPGIAAAAVVGLCYLAFVARRLASAYVVALGGLILFAGALPETARSWLDTPFDAAQREEFDGWRERIPLHTEVLWQDSPHATWFLLNRRSYMSVSQAAGTVFSKESTAEMSRRAEALSALVDPGYWFANPRTRKSQFKDLTPTILAGVCRDETLGFVVSSEDLGFAVSSLEWPDEGYWVHLYDCGKVPSGGGS